MTERALRLTGAIETLRSLPAAVRLGLTGIVLVLCFGLLASVNHLAAHHEQRDGQPGMSLDDLVGAYHGLDSPAPLHVRLEEGHPSELDVDDRATLLRWLESDRISEGYDDLDLGDAAPAEILDRACLRCHARRAEEGEGIGQTAPLEYWDDVEKLAFSRSIEAVPSEILLVSTHTHALSMGVLTLAFGLLVLATRWPARLRHGLVLVGGVALAVDVGCWWLARLEPAFVVALAVAGGLYVASLTVACVAVLLDLWLPWRAAPAEL